MRHPLFSYMADLLDLRLECDKYGSIKFSTCVIPAHILLPAPKGMVLKFLMPMSKLSLFNTRSGSHFSGLGHAFGSLLIPKMLISTCVQGR